MSRGGLALGSSMLTSLARSFRSRLTDCYVEAWKAKVAEADEKGTVPCCPDCEVHFTMCYGCVRRRGLCRGRTTLALTV